MEKCHILKAAIMGKKLQIKKWCVTDVKTGKNAAETESLYWLLGKQKETLQRSETNERNGIWVK